MPHTDRHARLTSDPTPAGAAGAVAGPLHRRPLPASTLAGIVLALVVVTAMALLSWRSLQERSLQAQGVSRALRVLQQSEALISTLKDAETSQRGYLLTGDEAYLEPWTGASSAVTEFLATLRRLLADSPEQLRRVDQIAAAAAAKLDELALTIGMRRNGQTEQALAHVRGETGKQHMARAREAVEALQTAEQSLLSARQREFSSAERWSLWVAGGGALLLCVLIVLGAMLLAREYRGRERHNWVRQGQLGLSERLLGDPSLEALAEATLAFLAVRLQAPVAAVWVPAGPGPDGRGQFRRVGPPAPPPPAPVLQAGAGLLGEAARQGRALTLGELPPDHLRIATSLGHCSPRQVVLMPARVDGRLEAVLEFGLLRPAEAHALELLERGAEQLAVAVRSARDRDQLERLLQETQRQAEELQTQQEELRVSNEELEEQGRVLKESQVRLESQHAELEQTNTQLEEQTQLLEAQRDELARAQGVVAAKAAELARASQYKSEFLANMSHELRTPLNSSLILARLLADNKDGNLTPEQVRFAQTIHDAGNDLLALINDILDLSKIEAGQMEVRPEPVVLTRLAETLRQTLDPVARDKSLPLHLALDPALPERLHTDAQRLAQILRNLLSNAIKFTERGQVVLRIEPEGADALRFAVHDTGIGIPVEQQGVIFEAFRQADGSTHRKYGGTGLGLAISRDLARLLGGDIAVQSTPGVGSTFTLRLPLQWRGADATGRTGDAGTAMSPDPGTGAATPISAVPRPSPAGGAAPSAARPAAPPRPDRTGQVPDDREQLQAGARTLLVIEDDPAFATILRDLAHEREFQCVVSHSADDGLAAAAAFAPSAILLDMNLPDQSGLTVLDQLKREPRTRHIPVHVISVADHSVAARELGAVGYALKPVQREQLLEAFGKLEARLDQRLREVLVVEDDARQRESMQQLLAMDGVRITTAETANAALEHLRRATFDCMVMDLNLPDLSGHDLLERMADDETMAFPPVIVYTGRSLSRDDEQRLRRYSRSIIIKDARSPERLLDEVTLFLHQVEADLPPDSQRMLRQVRHREKLFEGRRILIVEDDVRNIFALSSVLEPRGARVEIVRNGQEAVDRLTAAGAQPPDLVLMDVMMPVMDGLTATRLLRQQPGLARLPVIALTAKATPSDREECIAAGANDYIAKPLDVERLLSLVRVWMAK